MLDEITIFWRKKKYYLWQKRGQ